MNGLYYYHDMDGITYLWFHSDGSVFSLNQSRCNNLNWTIFLKNSKIPHEINFASGTWYIQDGEKLRIYLTDENGGRSFKGLIIDKNSFSLPWRCECTKYIKEKTFLKYSDVDIIQMETPNQLESVIEADTRNMWISEMLENYGSN